MENYVILYSPNKNFEDLSKFSKFASSCNAEMFVASNIEQLLCMLATCPCLVYNKKDISLEDIRAKLPKEYPLSACELETLSPTIFKNNEIDDVRIEAFLNKNNIYPNGLVCLAIKHLLKIMLMQNINTISRKYVYLFLNSIGIEKKTICRILRKHFEKYSPYPNIVVCLNDLFKKYTEEQIGG